MRVSLAKGIHKINIGEQRLWKYEIESKFETTYDVDSFRGHL